MFIDNILSNKRIIFNLIVKDIIMSLQECIKRRILELCEEKNITRYALANLAGIHKSTIKNLYNGRSKYPKVITIKIICDALGMTLSEFFDTEYFNNLEQEIQ